MTVLYQNIETGAVHDVTALVSLPKWKTVRRGSPASLTFTALPSDVEWVHGGILRVTEGTRGLFYGYIFRCKTAADNAVEITAYDQLRYLKNKQTYVFQNVTAAQILREICEDFGLETGEIADTGYVIPSMVEDGQELFDIILKALDLTLINTGRMFYLWDDFGKLTLSQANEPLPFMLGDGSLATGYSYESSIDGDTYNQIKLLRDNQETGRRDLYMFRDSGNIARWGILQHYETVDENMNAAQIAQRGEQLLELHNKPQKTFTVDSISDTRARAGRLIFVRIPEIKIDQLMLLEEVEHDLISRTMQLKIKAV